MPYIEKEKKVPSLVPTTSGELNYKITELLVGYLKTKGLSYQTCNDIVGALDNAKDEFRRRVQHSYEDKKILQNGDVYSSL